MVLLHMIYGLGVVAQLDHMSDGGLMMGVGVNARSYAYDQG
jgi:hypothetical protein